MTADELKQSGQVTPLLVDSPLARSEQSALLERKLTKKTKNLYYCIVTLGYASLIAQLISAKFAFSNCNTGLASISKHVFNVEIDAKHFIPLSLVLTTLDSLKDVTSIFPERDTRALLGLEMHSGILVFKDNKPSVQNLINFQKITCFNACKESFFTGVLITAMVINFVNTAMPSWISMNTWIGDYPAFDIPIGITLLICHTSYFLLLFANDVMIGYREFRNVKQSPFGLLFQLSKLIFIAPVIKIIITATYRSTKSAYTFDEFVKNVLHIENNSLRRVFKITAAASSSIVLILSRSLASFKYYLKPFAVDNGYKIDLLKDQPRVMTNVSASCCSNMQNKLSYLPIGLNRGLMIAFIIYGLVNDALQGNHFHEWINTAISILLALLGGGFVFMQVYFSETGHEQHVNARNELDQTENHGIVTNFTPLLMKRTNTQRIANFISHGANFGNQSTEGLVTIVAMISLLGYLIGNRNAAALGLLVGVESGWVNFLYFGDKIRVRVSQIVDKGTQLATTLINNCPPLFFAHSYHALEDVNLIDIPVNPGTSQTLTLDGFR